jgi:AICAR transformylase/IMP cyclohydrolase PurH
VRYGMNPQQDVRVVGGDGPLRVVHGTPSYLNLLDAVHGWQLVRDAPAALLARVVSDGIVAPGYTPGAEPDRSGWLAGLSGLTLASDGYLPFRDSVDHGARFGVARIVEPGGSTRSGEVAAACAEQGIALVRTGRRLFHHWRPVRASLRPGRRRAPGSRPAPGWPGPAWPGCG